MGIIIGLLGEDLLSQKGLKVGFRFPWILRLGLCRVRTPKSALLEMPS